MERRILKDRKTAAAAARTAAEAAAAPPEETEAGGTASAARPGEVDQPEPEGQPALAEPGTVAETSAADETITRIEAELEEVRDLLKRKQAEFENYRKRVERERQEFVSYAAAELVREILPVLDNLERALGAAQSGAEAKLGEGLDIIHRQFRDVLKRAGVREVEALGQTFDPHVHEAVARLESAEHKEGTVVDVLQKGYFLKERLLRPAMVRVVKSPERKGGETPEPVSSSEGVAGGPES